MSARRALATAVIALALTMGAVGCGDDTADPVTADSETSTTAPDGATVAEDEATGFYIPGELPDGWTIRFEQITNPWQQLCPCETEDWRGPGEARIKTFTSQRQEEPDGPYVFEGDTTVHRDIPGGYLSIEEGQVTADWFDGDVTRAIFAEGVEADIVEEMARGWTNDAPLAAPDGFELAWSGSTPAILRRTEFFWKIFRDGDHGMVVHVQPWMYDEPFDPSIYYPGAEPVTLDGNGLALVPVPGWDEPRFEGLWPGGAFVTVATNYGEINSHAFSLTREEILQVAGGFRPVSAEEWADYIEEIYGPTATEACRPLLLKPRLADLLVGPDDADADLGVENWEMNDGCRVPSPDEGSEANEVTDDPETEIPTIDTSTVIPSSEAPPAPTTAPHGD